MNYLLTHLPPQGALLGIAVAALVGGLSRGFSGFGAALVFVPLASAAVGPRAAVPVLALLETVSCLVFLPGAWRYAARREVSVMVAGAILAVPVGSLILAHADPVGLRWGLTVLVFMAVGLLASGWRYRGRDSVPLTLGVGAAGGLMSGAAMLGGVPPAVWWLGRSATARVMRASMNLYFAILTVAIVLAFAWRGLFGWPGLWLALVAGPAYGAGLWGGAALFGLASETTFRRAAYALILAAAVLGMPLWDPLTGR
ncbi:sulfite exporter TauE/SafE family protein [Roseomonas sp. CAU 1739]|uniref:sulfite exporter TauE/SafE family protein n=1 Tax=Roseomonas sp. CAU 1739 TaxID=3140364 RepID=UPI00325B8698